MIMLNHVYKMIYFYQYIFINDTYINSILFQFFYYELLTNISSKKIWGSKIFVNLA